MLESQFKTNDSFLIALHFLNYLKVVLFFKKRTKCVISSYKGKFSLMVMLAIYCC